MLLVYESPRKNVLGVLESPGNFSEQKSGNPGCWIKPSEVPCLVGSSVIIVPVNGASLYSDDSKHLTCTNYSY